jgi:hypothetical protein
LYIPANKTINIIKCIETGILKLKNIKNNIIDEIISLFFVINTAFIIKNIMSHPQSIQKKNIKSKKKL